MRSGKFIVRCDIEGVSGVTSYAEADPSMERYAYGREMLNRDLESLCRGLNDGGAKEILIYDEHFDGRNVDLNRIPENASVICGKPPYEPGAPGGLDRNAEGLILVGFHSKSGTGELLAHSYEPEIADIRINGVSVGEIGMETAIAGDFDVPLAMIAGDSAGVDEARALVPGVIGVAVKLSLGAEGGLCYPAAVSSGRIRDAARRLAEHGTDAAPWKLDAPTVEFTLRDTPYRTRYLELFGEPRLTGATVTECYCRYWQNKLAVQRSLR